MAPKITTIISSLSLGGFSGLLMIHFSSTELSKQPSASLGEFGVMYSYAWGPGIQSTYFRHLFEDGVNFFLRMPLRTGYTGGQDSNLSLSRVPAEIILHNSAHE